MKLKFWFSLPVQSLLDEPNPNSPANSQAAQLYQENKREYEKRVSAIVEQSWRDSWPHSQTMFSLKLCFPFVWLCCWRIVFLISIFKFLCTLLMQDCDFCCFISLPHWTDFQPSLRYLKGEIPPAYKARLILHPAWTCSKCSFLLNALASL